ncbi:MAG: helix-turn-helix domain-containing protein [Microcoleus vaginatus WJT46-NPBG5]|jgi:transposase|nr:helix-turn-helix domain-containing protein [Microcoleus vaginatus WJT46-NPBG5]
MAQARIKLTPHLSYEELTGRYRSCKNAKERSRWQAIWLLSRPDNPLSAEEVASVVGFSPDWVRKLAHRYNNYGTQGLIDFHRYNPGGKKAILTPEQQAKLSQALLSPPPDGGLWTGPKVSQWIALETGLKTSAVTGWNYLIKLGFKSQRLSRTQAE